MANVKYAGATGWTHGVYILETEEWGRLGIFSSLTPFDIQQKLIKVLAYDGQDICSVKDQEIEQLTGKQYNNSNPGVTTYNIWDLVTTLNPDIEGPNDEIWEFQSQVRGTFTYTKET
jgi:hypothetical protein